LRNGNHWYGSLADIDGDGDLDIAASFDSLFWLENQLPAETWTLHKVANGINSNYLGFCQDLNGDGAPDIASTPVASNGGYSYFANPGWEEIVINPAQQLYLGPTGDIDGDGDPDATYGGAGFGTTQAPGWAENTGSGLSWAVHDIAPPTSLQMIPTGLADIDGDGDTDFITLTFNTGTNIGSALWFANPLIPSSTFNSSDSQFEVEVFPNPTNGLVSLEIIGLPLTDLIVQVTDVHGRLLERRLLEKISATTVSLDLRDQPAGVYFLTVGGESEVAVRRILKL
ncbi:MAG: T9SS type A sorting domain-containing protein, partial [Bacteroidota bacterium]